ncbi:hypothetical protein [Cutibacterium porci]
MKRSDNQRWCSDSTCEQRLATRSL